MLTPVARGGRSPLRALALAALLALLGLWLPGGVERAQGASFQVSPTRFEFSLERRFTNFFTVTNNSEETLRIRVFAGFVEVGAAEEMEMVEGHPYDLSPWLVINPRRLSLQPGQKQVVRFSVRPPEAPEPGEYRTVVFFEELPRAPQAGGEPEAPPPGGVGFRIELLTRLGITLYGMAGEPRPDLALREARAAVEDAAVTVQGTLENTGNKHLQLQVTARLLGAEGEAQGRAVREAVMQRDQERSFIVRLERPPPGAYDLRLTVEADDTVLAERTLPVQVP